MLYTIPNELLGVVVAVQPETQLGRLAEIRQTTGSTQEAVADFVRETVNRYAWRWYVEHADMTVLRRTFLKVVPVQIRVRDMRWLFVALFGPDPDGEAGAVAMGQS